MALDFSIHVKRTQDRSIAQMLRLRGFNFHDEGDGYLHWTDGTRPAWLKCITHGGPEAGIRAEDEFEAILHAGGDAMDGDEDEDEDEDGGMPHRCSSPH